MAGELVDPAGAGRRPHEDPGRPRAGPRGRIVHCELVLQQILGDTGEPLDEAKVARRAAEVRVALEVGGLDDQAVTVPAAAGIPQVLADSGRQMRAPVGRDDARIVHHLHQDGDRIGRLHDLEIAVVAPACHRHPAARTAKPGAEVFRPPRKTRTFDGSARLRTPLAFVRHLRKPAVRRVLDERRAVVEPAIDEPELVVVAGPFRVILGDAVARLIVGPVGERGAEHALAEGRIGLAVEELGSASGERRHLFVGQERRVGQLFRPLQRRRRVARPDALQIRMAVRRARHGPGVVGRLGRRRRRQGQQAGPGQEKPEVPIRHHIPHFCRSIAAMGFAPYRPDPTPEQVSQAPCGVPEGSW